MAFLIRLTAFAILAVALMLAAPFAAKAQSGSATLEQFIAQLPPGELVPGAERYGPIATEPVPVAAAFRGDEVVGYVFLNSQIVNSAGYSAKPIHIAVGLDTSGTIVGVRLVAHSEPIVLIGIEEQRVIDYLAPFVGYNPLQAAAEGRGLPKTDIVSGATVTVLVMGESVVRAAVRVARALQLGSKEGAGAAAAAAEARVVDPDASAPADWDSLVEQGAITRLRLSIGEVNQAFAESGNEAAAKRPQSGDPEDTFIEMYTALVSQPAIGRTLLGDSEYQSVMQMLAPGQHAIIVAGDGVYSFKGSGYVRGGVFDRIEILQGTEAIRFRDRAHRRIGSLAAEGAPGLREIGVFLVPQNVEFDPTAPWRLQLLVQRSIGALDKAFIAFELPYQLPQAYTKPAPAPAASAAAPAAGGGSAPGVAPGAATAGSAGSAATGAMAGRASQSASSAGPGGIAQGPTPGAAPGGVKGDPVAGGAPQGQGGPVGGMSAEGGSLEELEQVPLWQRIWQSKVAAIVMLGVMLAALTLIFFFQDPLVKREKLYDRVRLVFLATTLIWLGWMVQAQLSVVNVLTFTTALRTGFDWSAFLIDPLVFILWCSVAAALLFWGRGPFCGWLCPFGALQELTNRIAKALKVPQIKVPWAIHERAITLKYIIFLGLFGVSLGSLAMAEILSEVEPFKTAIILRFMREWWFVAFAVALLVAGLFIERFFCRYLCPLGAALAIPGRLRIFDWLKRYRECGNPCMRCFNECPVEAIYPEGPINPNECIGCLHCQMLYHHDRKCPVMIQRRVKREKREAISQPVARPVAAAPMTATTLSREARP